MNASCHGDNWPLHALGEVGRSSVNTLFEQLRRGQRIGAEGRQDADGDRGLAIEAWPVAWLWAPSSMRATSAGARWRHRRWRAARWHELLDRAELPRTTRWRKALASTLGRSPRVPYPPGRSAPGWPSHHVGRWAGSPQLGGSSQMRIARSVPNRLPWPTPGRRWDLGQHVARGVVAQGSNTSGARRRWRMMNSRKSGWPFARLLHRAEGRRGVARARRFLHVHLGQVGADGGFVLRVMEPLPSDCATTSM